MVCGLTLARFVRLRGGVPGRDQAPGSSRVSFAFTSLSQVRTTLIRRTCMAMLSATLFLGNFDQVSLNLCQVSAELVK